MRIEEPVSAVSKLLLTKQVNKAGIDKTGIEYQVTGKKSAPSKAKNAKILTQDEINNAVEKLNSTMEKYNYDLRFKYYEEAERMMVQVIDISTQEVIKEIPPEEILKIVARIKEMVGMIIDETI